MKILICLVTILLFIFNCKTTEKKKTYKDDEIIFVGNEIMLMELKSDNKIVFTNQEFMVTRNIKNYSATNFGTITETLYIDNFEYDKFKCNLVSFATCSGIHALRINSPGRHILKIVVNRENKYHEANDNSKQIEIIVHDQESYIKDALMILESLKQIAEIYRNQKINDYTRVIKQYSDYTDHLSKITPELYEMRNVPDNYKYYLILGIKKTSIALLNLIVMTEESGKNYNISYNDASKKVQIQETYFKNSISMMDEAKVDLTIALNILLESDKNFMKLRKF